MREDGRAQQLLGHTQHAAAFELGEQHDDQQGHEKHAPERERVGQVHSGNSLLVFYRVRWGLS